MDSINSTLAVICMFIALVCISKGLILLVDNWKQDIQVKRKLDKVHRDFLLESLKHKRD